MLCKSCTQEYSSSPKFNWSSIFWPAIQHLVNIFLQSHTIPFDVVSRSFPRCWISPIITLHCCMMWEARFKALEILKSFTSSSMNRFKKKNISFFYSLCTTVLEILVLYRYKTYIVNSSFLVMFESLNRVTKRISLGFHSITLRALMHFKFILKTVSCIQILETRI